MAPYLGNAHSKEKLKDVGESPASQPQTGKKAQGLWGLEYMTQDTLNIEPIKESL